MQCRRLSHSVSLDSHRPRVERKLCLNLLVREVSTILTCPSSGLSSDSRVAAEIQELTLRTEPEQPSTPSQQQEIGISVSFPESGKSPGNFEGNYLHVESQQLFHAHSDLRHLD